MTYNRLRYDVDFKRETGKEVLNDNIKKNREKLDYQEKFTLERLIECRTPFDDYLKTHGTELPVHTRYSWINSIGNSLASKSHFIRTNQPYAKKINKIFDEAIENKKKTKGEATKLKRSFESNNIYPDGTDVTYKTLKEKARPVDLDAEESKIVILALQKIKEVHDQMVRKNIYGDIRKAIENILNKFKMDINSSKTIFKLPDINAKDPKPILELEPANIIMTLNIYERERIKSVPLESVLTKRY